MKFFKPQPVKVRTVKGVEEAKAIERIENGIFARIGRVYMFVPNGNIVEWL